MNGKTVTISKGQTNATGTIVEFLVRVGKAGEARSIRGNIQVRVRAESTPHKEQSLQGGQREAYGVLLECAQTLASHLRENPELP